MSREAGIVWNAAALLGYPLGVPAFGALMHHAEEQWREYNLQNGIPGAEHTVHACAAFMVPCQCQYKRPVLDRNGHCDWCCGAGRVTKRVRQAQRAARRSKR